jgi:hypothetical protein
MSGGASGDEIEMERKPLETLPLVPLFSTGHQRRFSLLGQRALTSGLGDDVSAKLHGDAAEGSAVGGNVKENLGVTAQ